MISLCSFKTIKIDELKLWYEDSLGELTETWSTREKTYQSIGFVGTTKTQLCYKRSLSKHRHQTTERVLTRQQQSLISIYFTDEINKWISIFLIDDLSPEMLFTLTDQICASFRTFSVWNQRHSELQRRTNNFSFTYMTYGHLALSNRLYMFSVSCTSSNIGLYL